MAKSRTGGAPTKAAPKPAKPAKPAKKPKAAPPNSESVSAEEAVDAAPMPRLLARDRRLIMQAGRFLIGIANRTRAVRARREGYSTKQHQKGWSLWRLAAGEQISLDHWLDDLHASATPDSGETMRILRELDDFENRWFPRTERIIDHLVPRAERETFHKVFFKNLSQQPLGPGVIQSVSTFLQRVDELRTSKLVGAVDVADELVSRGLTPARSKEMRDLIKRMEQAPELPAAAPVNAEERKKAAREQSEAIEDLRGWYNDWRTTLLPIFSGPDALALGFARPKGGRKEDEGEGEEDQDGDGEDPSKG